MRRRLPLLRPVLILGAALLCSVIVVLLIARIDRVVVAPGHLAGGTVAVYAPWTGKVERIFARPGERAAAGRPLVQMETAPLRGDSVQVKARIEALEERLRVARSELGRLRGKVHPAEVEKASRDLERARLELASAETRLQLMSQLWEKKLTTKLEMQDAELTQKLAKLALEEAEQSAALLASQQEAEIGQLGGEIRRIEEEIVQERAAQAEIERKLGLGAVVAGADGVVLGDRLLDLEGQTVREGDELLRLSVAAVNRFDGVLKDSGRAFAKPGYRVAIRLEGYPWLIHGSLSGRVNVVADQRSDDGGFPVEIAIDSSSAPGPLYDGMKGEARIVVEEKVSLGRLLVEKVVGKQSP